MNEKLPFILYSFIPSQVSRKDERIKNTSMDKARFSYRYCSNWLKKPVPKSG
jgi:hypothetical protein